MKHPDTEPARERCRGVAVNERPMVAYLMDLFDSVARLRDRAEMMALLTKVDLNREQAASTTDAVKADPNRYGY